MGKMLLVFEWDGKTIRKETKGFKGQECVKKTSFIEESLGDAKQRKYTNEFFTESNKEQNKNTY